MAVTGACKPSVPVQGLQQLRSHCHGNHLGLLCRVCPAHRSGRSPAPDRRLKSRPAQPVRNVAHLVLLPIRPMNGRSALLARWRRRQAATTSRSSAWLKLMISTRLPGPAGARPAAPARNARTRRPGGCRIWKNPVAAVDPGQRKRQRRQHLRQRMAHMATAKQATGCRALAPGAAEGFAHGAPRPTQTPGASRPRSTGPGRGRVRSACRGAPASPLSGEAALRQWPGVRGARRQWCPPGGRQKQPSRPPLPAEQSLV
jgi:hypothetical protein